jgi:hypothetical protein
MVGAVAGTPGTLPTNWISALSGVTQTVVGTGTANGISYVDIRVNGTTTSAGGIQIKPDGNAGVISATASQAWAMSLWVSVVAGSTTNTTGQRLIVNEYSAGPTYLRTSVAATNILSGGSTLGRVSGVITTGASTTILEPILVLDINSGVAIDITLRIGMPQLEQGAFTTSVIPTTSAAATRSADVASITGANFSSWYNATEGTTYTSAQVGYTVPGGWFPIVAGINDGTANNRLEQGYLTANLAGFGVVVGGVDQGSVYLATTASIRNLANAYKLNNGGSSCNGSAVSTLNSMAVPVVNQLSLGNTPFAGNFLNGTIKRLTYWNTRLPNTTLQAITT